MSLLLGKSENKNPANFHGETLMHLAAKKGYSKLFLKLFKDAEDKHPADVFGQTPLHCACPERQK